VVASPLERTKGGDMRGAEAKVDRGKPLRSDGVWKVIALGLSFVVVGLGAATVFTYVRPSNRSDELAEFFENDTVGLHWVGPDGIILRASQAELDLLGYRREEYIGHNIAEFHADQEVIADILARLSRGETLTNYQARLRCKDGSIKAVVIDSSVVWREGKFMHTRCITRPL
jgi:PAS domain S-box-containing protein